MKKEQVLEKIVSIRRNKKITRSDAAFHLGVTDQRLYRMESGVNHLNLETMLQISDFLQVHVTDFFTPVTEIEKTQDLTIDLQVEEVPICPGCGDDDVQAVNELTNRCLHCFERFPKIFKSKQEGYK